MADGFVRDDYDVPLAGAFDVAVADAEVVVSSGAWTIVLSAAAALESARRLAEAAQSLGCRTELTGTANNT